MAMQMHMNKPSSTIKAAGVGGLFAGVPIGMYVGGFAGGLINYNWPDFYAIMDKSMDVEAAIGGIVTVVVGTAIGYFKTEKVLRPEDLG